MWEIPNLNCKDCTYQTELWRDHCKECLFNLEQLVTELDEKDELKELEMLDHSLDRPCIRECKNCLEANFCPDRKE